MLPSGEHGPGERYEEISCTQSRARGTLGLRWWLLHDTQDNGTRWFEPPKDLKRGDDRRRVSIVCVIINGNTVSGKGREEKRGVIFVTYIRSGLFRLRREQGSGDVPITTTVS